MLLTKKQAVATEYITFFAKEVRKGQTNKCPYKHNLHGEGNDSLWAHWGFFFYLQYTVFN